MPLILSTDALEPAAAEPVSAWRVYSVFAGLAGLAILFAARLVHLQWNCHDEFAHRVQELQFWDEELPARPGDIVDRDGRTLAATITAPSLYVDPHMVESPEQLAESLARVLGLDAAVFARQLRQERHKRFLWVRRRLTREEADRVRELGWPPHVLGFRTEFRRFYPQGIAAAHVLGLRDIDNVGRGGLEEAYNELLRGRPGRRRLRRDARGFVLDVLRDDAHAPQPGVRIVTTLDSRIQAHVEQALDTALLQWSPRSCCAIVMDPHSAEILALASRPALDPRQPGEVLPESWSNRAIAAVFEPGSTFKPLVTAWAIDHGVLAREEVLDCEGGAYRMGPRLLHDHHPYGRLTVSDVLVKSSNIGMAKIGERLTNSGLQQVCTAFGFGRPTGLGLPGELPGIVRPFENWDRYSTGSLPMGQEIAVTPLQLIRAHAALANGGRLLTPRITRGLRSPASHNPQEPARPLEIEEAGSSFAPVAGESTVTGLIAQVTTPETSQWIITGPMREVVTRGTGRAARLEEYAVFGKTGTSQVIDPATGAYSHERHICSFVGGLPAENPRVLVLVMVEEPQGPGANAGGTVAAPIAREILSHAARLLRLAPQSARR